MLDIYIIQPVLNKQEDTKNYPYIKSEDTVQKPPFNITAYPKAWVRGFL